MKILSNFSSLALTVWDRQCLEDYELKDELLNKSISNGGFCRTAPATPGLFNRAASILYWTQDFLSFSHPLVCLDQGLSKHQEVSFTPVTKVKTLIVIFWDLLGATKS